MKRMRWIAAAGLAALVSVRAEARVTRIVIATQQVVAGGAAFAEMARVQHERPVGEVARRGEVVGDEEQGETAVFLQLSKQVQHADTDGSLRDCRDRARRDGARNS